MPEMGCRGGPRTAAKARGLGDWGQMRASSDPGARSSSGTPRGLCERGLRRAALRRVRQDCAKKAAGPA